MWAKSMGKTLRRGIILLVSGQVMAKVLWISNSHCINWSPDQRPLITFIFIYEVPSIAPKICSCYMGKTERQLTAFIDKDQMPKAYTDSENVRHHWKELGLLTHMDACTPKVDIVRTKKRRILWVRTNCGRVLISTHVVRWTEAPRSTMHWQLLVVQGPDLVCQISEFQGMSLM